MDVSSGGSAVSLPRAGGGAHPRPCLALQARHTRGEPEAPSKGERGRHNRTGAPARTDSAAFRHTTTHHPPPSPPPPGPPPGPTPPTKRATRPPSSDTL